MLEKSAAGISEHRLKKAKGLLEQAEYLMNNQMYDGSINRSYYAIFNAIRSLLSLAKLDSKKHTGMLSFFDRYFVKTGIFEKRFSEIAHLAFHSRQDFDYEDFVIPTEKDALLQLQNARQLIAEVEAKQNKFISGELNLPETPEQSGDDS